MTHLSDAEFVDLIDGELPAARAAHLQACPACGEQASAMRNALAAALDVDAQAPSPLFWDHFGQRVSDAVAQQPPPATSPAWTAHLLNPAFTWAAAASIALLLMVGALWRATLVAPARPATPPAAARSTPAAAGISLLDHADLDQDAAWAVVRSAADAFVWEDAQAIGIAARPGSAERAVLELSSAERAELARLLEEELKRSGA
jgi:hypothetical protein